jgi:hypothetical protein
MEPRHVPKLVGVLTLGIGGALAARPELGRHAGVEPGPTRAIGVADLALVPGLLSGRAPARWMAARAGLNVLIAAHLRTRPGAAARAATLALAGLTAGDALTAARLR